MPMRMGSPCCTSFFACKRNTDAVGSQFRLCEFSSSRKRWCVLDKRRGPKVPLSVLMTVRKQIGVAFVLIVQLSTVRHPACRAASDSNPTSLTQSAVFAGSIAILARWSMPQPGPSPPIHSPGCELERPATPLWLAFFFGYRRVPHP